MHTYRLDSLVNTKNKIRFSSFLDHDGIWKLAIRNPESYKIIILIAKNYFKGEMNNDLMIAVSDSNDFSDAILYRGKYN